MIMEKLKMDESEKDVFKTEVIQELKSQIGKEERKLQQVSRIICFQIRLRLILKSFSSIINQINKYSVDSVGR